MEGAATTNKHRNFPQANMSPMTVVLLCPVPGPSSVALLSALMAGLGAVRAVSDTAEAQRLCLEEPRASLVVDLREADAEGAAAVRRLRLQLPGVRMLSLVSPGRAAPPDSDAVLVAPFYLIDVVRWCARASQAPLADGALPDLAAGLSHEVGNALTALQLEVELLKQERPDDDLREHLELIEQASRRIQAVVADVTTASDRQPVRPDPTRLEELLTAARRVLSDRDAKLARRIEVSCEDQPLQADVALLGAALADLWQYLLLAGEPSDALVIQARGRDDETVGIRAQASVPRLPADAPARLFTPLWARQALGLPAGLSLSSARAAFLRHGGELRALPRVGDTLAVEAILPRRCRALSETTP
jgi:signal transduction histidine kinase